MLDTVPGSTPKTVLIVATDAVFRSVLKNWLRTTGHYRVVAATSMATALDHAPSCPPNLVVYVAESAEPGGDALSSVRRHPSFAALPIVVVGGDEPGRVETWPLATFLPYPFRIGTLATCIAEMVA